MLKLVCFICLVHLVCLVQPNKRDKTNNPNNCLLTLANFFSVLLETREGQRRVFVKIDHEFVIGVGQQRIPEAVPL